MARFEKSLYDLIRGLRNHKGNEKEYIQKSLKECRGEVRSQDMDVKATALLKLIYLEMVGHDMSWASFHVLEVMSSPKYHQKRVGYLGAVQSFRTDTEVLMLATNLLKKDLGVAAPTVISLPIATLPHVITPSLALSTLTDLLPRLSHSHSNIRKKTLVTLYRLALVYPEALRAAWPKIKERLMDPEEDASVTAAIVNVVCELGWRRPHDFLPLAPRLFELLVDGGNNWMAIKLIKLFATLTPLEPRLVKKLLPPLTNIIRTTPAMSLLYECINGIIQGGILHNGDETSDTDEIATLCVNKLRGMVMINGDPNLKYVALLAFNKIIATHPHLVSQQEDVILECIDSPDITIRIQALDLVQGMVTGDNLVSIVSRLMKQLKTSIPTKDRLQSGAFSTELSTDSDDDAHAAITSHAESKHQTIPLPEDYRTDVIARILSMSSKNNYANILDFDWYIDVLTQLIRMAPLPRTAAEWSDHMVAKKSIENISRRIGDELRNVAVKVRAMRSTALSATERILSDLINNTPVGHSVTSEALVSVTWMLGEYATLLARPDDTLNRILQLLARTQRSEIISIALQAAVKVLATMAGSEMDPWTSERKSKISLLIARVLHSIETLTLHPDLEVQERAIEVTELLKLTAEAVSSQTALTEDAPQNPPLLLTQAIPALFNGWELNSVASGAQSNVPISDGLALNTPIHANLKNLLSKADAFALFSDDGDEFATYYHQRPAPTSISSSAPAINRLQEPNEDHTVSYQHPREDSYLDADIITRRRAERVERNKDDPFYIDHGEVPEPSTSIHNILQHSNGPDLDIDAIPIMQLDLDKMAPAPAPHSSQTRAKTNLSRQKVVIAADETLSNSDGVKGKHDDSGNNSDSVAKAKNRRLKQSLLQVDSSTIGSFSLDPTSGRELDHDLQQREDAEMQQAMREVERLRLMMQRANEQVDVAQGVDTEGTVVRKKKKKKTKAVDATANTEGSGGDSSAVIVKPKKKKKPKKIQSTNVGDDPNVEDGTGMAQESIAEVAVVSKKKKKKKPQLVAIEDAL